MHQIVFKLLKSANRNLRRRVLITIFGKSTPDQQGQPEQVRLFVYFTIINHMSTVGSNYFRYEQN